MTFFVYLKKEETMISFFLGGGMTFFCFFWRVARMFWGKGGFFFFR